MRETSKQSKQCALDSQGAIKDCRNTEAICHEAPQKITANCYTRVMLCPEGLNASFAYVDASINKEQWPVSRTRSYAATYRKPSTCKTTAFWSGPVEQSPRLVHAFSLQLGLLPSNMIKSFRLVDEVFYIFLRQTKRLSKRYPLPCAMQCQHECTRVFHQRFV